MQIEFQPTYLYIKQHTITKKLYFGKTIKDPIKYKGSGKYWKLHIKMHGKEYVETLWYCLFLDEEELSKFALNFSTQNNIVTSNLWANLKYEDGLDGGSSGRIITKEFILLMSKLSMGNKYALGLRHSEETKQKISLNLMGNAYSLGYKQSQETRQKMQNSKFGNYYPHKIVICPYCGKSGGKANMTRYHFNNCKFKDVVVNSLTILNASSLLEAANGGII